MNEIKVNLLNNRTARRSGQPGKSSVKFFISPLLIAVVFIGSFVLGRISQSEAASVALSSFENVPIIGQVSYLIGSSDRALAGEDSDRINILLVGMGGEGHDGPNLTDTLILTSIRPSDNRVAMLSIPRDLLVSVPNYGWRKINSVNAYGEMQAVGRGGELTKKTIEGLLGIDIPYYIRIDFDGFRSIIDAVGGIDVYVETAFTDPTYPTYDHGVQAISFEEGWQHLDGEQALQFARSRHGNNGEGSDFARSRRQQKVLTALKNKFMSFKTFSSPSTITNTLSALQSNIATNLNIGEILRLAKMSRDVERDDIMHEVLDNGPDSVLVDKLVNSAYVLLPKNNDWTLLRRTAEGLFENAEMADPTEAPPPPPEERVDAAVEIRNGNGTSGVAREAAGQLSQYGFRITKIGNADSFDYKQTVIYDLTYGQDRAALDYITKLFPRAQVLDDKHAAAPEPSSGADFLIVLGQN
jgi:LCP family protein required for cell wall assembly